MTARSDGQPERCQCTPCRLHELDTQSYSHNSSRSGFAIAAGEAVPSSPVDGAAISSRGVA
jgi:hypothetical protein